MRPEGQTMHMRDNNVSNHQVPPQGKASLMVIDIMIMHHKQQTGQGAPQNTKINRILLVAFLLNLFRECGRESVFMATVEPHTST